MTQAKSRLGGCAIDLHLYPERRPIAPATRGKLGFSGRGMCHMTFKVGDTVVYPHHGAARIEEIETRTIKGAEMTYLVLKVDKGDLKKLASGDVNKVAEVVRDLWRRDRERGLSAGEKRMLAKARQILVSELALAEKTNEDKAEALLDEVLANLLWATESRPRGRRPSAERFAGIASGRVVLAG